MGAFDESLPCLPLDYLASELEEAIVRIPFVTGGTQSPKHRAAGLLKQRWYRFSADCSLSQLDVICAKIRSVVSGNVEFDPKEDIRMSSVFPFQLVKLREYKALLTALGKPARNASQESTICLRWDKTVQPPQPTAIRMLGCLVDLGVEEEPVCITIGEGT